MSCNVCRTCKHESTCTFPRNVSVTIVQCEEYEYAEPQAEAKIETTVRPAACAREAAAAA